MNPTGSWIWYELMTPDVASAAKFYSDVIGWKPGAQVAVPGYRILASAKGDVCGLFPMPEGANFGGAVWVGYVAVEDVDAAAAAAQGAGAIPCMPVTDIDGVGRMAMFLDPQGAPFYLMRGAVEGGVSRSFAPEVGHCQWNELVTSDPEAAVSFYSRLLGWKKGDVMPMGPAGNYQFLLNGSDRVGAAMKRTRENARPIWRFYFGVEDIDAAARRIVAGGGTLMGDPQPVPGEGYAVVAVDPQGGEFGVAGARQD